MATGIPKFSANLLSVLIAEQACLRTITSNDNCQKCWQFFGLWWPDSTSFAGWPLEFVINLPGSLPPILPQSPAAQAPESPKLAWLALGSGTHQPLLQKEKKKILEYLAYLRFSWKSVLQPQGKPGSCFFWPRNFSSCSSSWLILLLNLPQTCTFFPLLSSFFQLRPPDLHLRLSLSSAF